VPFRVDVVAEFLRLAPSLGVRGLSVTIPHKETVMALLARTDPSVRGAGACNTLVWEQGGWTGYNTDIAGFLAPLQPALAAGRVRRATVVGAGGGARAVVWALRGAGVEVLVVNRNLQRAQHLAAEMGAAAIALSAGDLAAQVARHSDLIVQATSVGMHAGAADAARGAAHDPIAAVPLAGHETVYDIVYTPPNTPLIQRAREAGCQVVTGGEMLLGQAYEQFRLFTGIEYPASERGHMSAALGAG
jgi:3-dehydroquinate dehydratase/shikimate dehydrogenase